MADTKDSMYTDPWCDPCAKDGKYATVDSYCPICVEFFCKDCIQFHATCERTKGHNVKHGIDMPSCQAEKPPKYEECPIHPGDLKEYFCIDHCTLICPECQNDHIRCLIKHATVMSKTLNNKDINSFEIEVTDAKKETTNAKYDVECKINSVEGNRKRMLKIVEEEYDKMKRIIAERFNNVAKEINNKCDEKVSSLTTLMKVFSDGKADYDSALNIIQTGARSKLDTKLFLKLQSSLDKIRHNNARLRQLEITKALKAADLEFYVDSRWTSLLSCYPKIGKVEKTMSMSPTVLLGKTEFPPIKYRPFREITVTAELLLQIRTLGFGTFSLGQQFSTCHFCFNDKKQEMLFIQQERSDGIRTEEIPMTVLIAPDKETLVAFGYDAEKTYEELTQYGKHNDYFYFPYFTTKLRNEFNKTNLENLTIMDSTGKAVPAKTIYVLAVKFFCDELLGTLQKRLCDITTEDITWAIKVPTFWTDAAKDFIKKAAKEAGIPTMKVFIVTESEAAVVFCRRMLSVGTHLILEVGGTISVFSLSEDEVLMVRYYDRLCPSVFNFCFKRLLQEG